MLLVDNLSVSKQEEELTRIYKESAKVPLLFEDVVKEVLPRLHESWDIKYPIEVRLPPNKDQLRNNSYDPSRVFSINEPIISQLYGVPMWFGNSSDGLQLVGMGFENGDRRFESRIYLNDKSIHAFLGGATGHGKSVAINSVIHLLCYIYPPWELSFVMSDAKINEFSKYMNGAVPPHIRSISAASDPDYIVSVLEYYKNEMKFFNSVYAAYGSAGNIKEFRKNSKFNLARTVIVIDEVTVTLNGNKASRIEDLVEDYSRLGRNTAYHLFLASQDASAMTAGIMTNITVRAALGCDSKVSEKIIMNPEASLYFNEKGRMIVNTEPTRDPNNRFNQHFRVPFVSDGTFGKNLKELEDYGKKFNWDSQLTTYNETKYLDESQYMDKLSKAPLKPHTVYLGEPSFIYTEADEMNMLKMEFTGEDQENVVILGGNSSATKRYVKTMLANLNRISSVSNSFNYIICSDVVLAKEIPLSEYARVYENIRSIDDDPYKEIKEYFFDRYLMISADDKVFSGRVEIHPEIKPMMESLGGIDKSWITEVNLKRVSAMLDLMRRPPVAGNKVPANASVEVLIRTALELLVMYDDIGTIGGERTTKSKFRKIYLFFLGFNRINGLGINGSSSERNFMKAFLQEAFYVNMHITVSAFDTEDMGDYKNSFRYVLYDRTVPVNWVRTLGKAEVPEVADVLSFLKDKMIVGEEPLRFKKFAMEGESFV